PFGLRTDAVAEQYAQDRIVARVARVTGKLAVENQAERGIERIARHSRALRERRVRQERRGDAHADQNTHTHETFLQEAERSTRKARNGATTPQPHGPERAKSAQQAGGARGRAEEGKSNARTATSR